MTTVTNIRTITPAMPEVVGYVEAVAIDRLLGWAWSPSSPALRAAIELRLGDMVIANTVADSPRADLASNGIGDGCHAYSIGIPLEFRERSAELRVFAKIGDGPAVAIGATPAAEGLADQVAKLLRGFDMLMNSQRMIHRNLQAVLTARPGGTEPDGESASAVLARMVEAQLETAEQISGVERFVMRLDEQMSRMSPVAVKSAVGASSVPWMALFALGVSGTALVVSVVGLLHAL